MPRWCSSFSSLRNLGDDFLENFLLNLFCFFGPQQCERGAFLGQVLRVGRLLPADVLVLALQSQKAGVSKFTTYCLNVVIVFFQGEVNAALLDGKLDGA